MLPTRAAAVLCLAWIFAACDSGKEAPPSPAAPEAEPADAPAAKPAPSAPPPLAAKPGTVVLGRVYVQDCTDPACPKLLQDQAVAHCEALELHGLSWRLVTLEEVEALAGNEALADMDSFQWTASAWDEDPAQFWIFDPASKSKTTARPDRKPFTARCAAESAP